MSQYMADQEAKEREGLKNRLQDILNNDNLTEEEKFKVGRMKGRKEEMKKDKKE